MHIAAHAFGKITLFFAAGSIYTAAHMTEVSQLDGIGRRMPWTMGAFAIGALGMIGMPPTAGFLGKWFMLTGAMQTANWLAVAVIVVSTLLNAGYFLPIVYRAFFREPRGRRRRTQAGEAPWPIVLALTATAAGTVLLFFLPDIPFALATLMIGTVMSWTTTGLYARQTIRRLWIVFVVVLAATVLDGSRRSSIIRTSASTARSASAPGSASLAASRMIVFAKALGALLKRPDTYYDS